MISPERTSHVTSESEDASTPWLGRNCEAFKVANRLAVVIKYQKYESCGRVIYVKKRYVCSSVNGQNKSFMSDSNNALLLLLYWSSMYGCASYVLDMVTCHIMQTTLRPID